MALEPGDAVALTILSRSEVHAPGRIAAHRHDSVELHSTIPARTGEAVKLEGERTMFLGEVRGCRPHADGFALEIALRHALYDTVELARLARKLLDERL